MIAHRTHPLRSKLLIVDARRVGRGITNRSSVHGENTNSPPRNRGPRASHRMSKCGSKVNGRCLMQTQDAETTDGDPCCVVARDTKLRAVLNGEVYNQLSANKFVFIPTRCQ